jgi:hypothetical protein
MEKLCGVQCKQPFLISNLTYNYEQFYVLFLPDGERVQIVLCSVGSPACVCMVVTR